jgi:hypothetical protein
LTTAEPISKLRHKKYEKLREYDSLKGQKSYNKESDSEENEISICELKNDDKND